MFKMDIYAQDQLIHVLSGEVLAVPGETVKADSEDYRRIVKFTEEGTLDGLWLYTSQES